MRVLASDGSQWLRDIQKDDDMSFEHKPHNPNHGGVSRSGNVTGFHGTDRHPSDRRMDWSDWLLLAAIAAVLTCICLGVTVWAPKGGTF